MDAEEKQVIDEFQGKESYAEVMLEAAFYLRDPADTLLEDGLQPFAVNVQPARPSGEPEAETEPGTAQSESSSLLPLETPIVELPEVVRLVAAPEAERIESEHSPGMCIEVQAVTKHAAPAAGRAGAFRKATQGSLF